MLYDGTQLVSRSIERGTPIIFVNFNYRLGPLGFPQGQEADNQRALNLGLHDQTAALEWVNENIHLFGGDSSKVTMFGESAGAMMTGIQCLNPRLGKLARGAILQSGSANGPQIFPAARNEAAWQDFVSKVRSCSDVAESGKSFACLKDAPTEDIIAALRESTSLADNPWTPTLDIGEGSVYPDYASRLYAKGQFAKLPFIAGTNLDEGTMFASQQEVSGTDLKAMIIAQHSPPTISLEALEKAVDQILELYPDNSVEGSPYGTGDELFGMPRSFKRAASIMGDINFQAPRRQWNQVAARHGVHSYGYHFTEPQGSSELGGQSSTFDHDASQPGVDLTHVVKHTAEIPYVFGEVPATDLKGHGLSTVIMDYWISFTVSLNPNDGNGVQRPAWPQYTPKEQASVSLHYEQSKALMLGFEDDTAAARRKHHCNRG
ncbi:hypothetical protein NMY22_g15853 [Coprinellus aureogranulatus]|nr:hypothetical protein NMY22_g15853 [Coprinellus aureogranulatus]